MLSVLGAHANATYHTLEHLSRSVNDRNHTDLLILDFSKAFDKVAHKRLLLKLEYYGIRGLVLAWIKAWLIGRTQQLALEGEFSEKSCGGLESRKEPCWVPCASCYSLMI